MADIYAADLPVESQSTLDGTENFVMFDTTSGKKATLNEVANYINARESAPRSASDAQILADIARPFNSSTTYSVGDYVTKDGDLYKCKIASTGEWAGGNWIRVILSDDVESNISSINILNSNVAELQTKTTNNTSNIQTNASDIANMDVRVVELEESDHTQTDSIDTISTKLTTFADELEVDEEGLVYLLNNGERIAGPYGPFAGGGGGGGGSGNNAILTVQNTTGWLSKTISEGADCSISITWSSTEDEIPTGNGTLKISVNGAAKATLEIAQGAVTTNITRYLGAGSNAVRVQVSDVYGNSRTINFSVNAISLSLSSPFDSSSPFSGSIQFPYVPVGAVSKTVHFILDGTDIGTQETSVSGRQLSYSIPAQTHGAHSLSVYFEATINEEVVRSNTLYYELICIEEGNTATIITSSFNQSTATQYDSLQIPYYIYSPTALSAEVVLSANNVILSTQTVDRTEQSYTYRVNDPGTLIFKISSGGTTKTITITVAEADIDVEAETEDLALYLSSAGRSNMEEHPDTWEYNNISAEFSGFNWVSDGWQSDADGITVMRVNGSARLTIPYKIFETDFRQTGKTLEFEFATRDILNYDSVIMSCMSDNRGFSLTAQKALLKSEQSEISTQYKEDEHVRISFVVEKRTENRLLLIYINGIASGVIQYPANDDFSQVTPVNVTIGSNGCTTDIYNIRIYDNDLTRYQILDNWIADTEIGSEMMDRYNHNNVYDEYGNVVIAKLPRDLPYMIIECPELPQYKGDKKTISGTYVDPQRPSKSFTFTGAQADVQGTSSQYYARKNYKIKFKNGFEINGQHASDYAMNADSIPTSTFTFKADVASSEGANNVELVRLYNDSCPYLTPAQEDNPNVRQGIDGFPIVIFWSDGTNTSFLGKYNFNNDKGTEEVFGFVEEDESWEIKNNTSDRVLWKSDDFESSAVDEDGKTVPAWTMDFEGRYPDGYDNPAQLKELATWLKSTDRTQATNEALPEPVTYEEVIYTVDSPEYRLAKFKDEAELYLELDSALFYYLFTELFLMVDSRAKNAFPSFIGTEITT